MPKELSRLEAMRGMRLSRVEAVSSTLWTALSIGVIPQGFALYLGASPFVIGLLGSVQALAGLATLAGAYIVERRSERRMFSAFLAGGGRTLWLLLGFAALFLPKPAALFMLVGVVAVTWGMLSLVSPAWISWMNDLVPEGMRGRYFAGRSMVAGIAGLIAGPLAGRFLDAGQAQWGPKTAFAVLFFTAGAIGLVNFLNLWMQPEPAKSSPKTPPRLDWEYLRVPLQNAPFRRFLTHFAFWVFAQGVAGPFFNIYMLEVLKLSFFQVQLVGGFGVLCQMAAAPMVGYLVDKYGNRPLYQIAYVLVTTLPLFWVFTRPDRPWLTLGCIVVAQFLSGVITAALVVTQFNLMLGLSASGQTPRYSAVWSTTVGVAGFLAPLVGGAVADATRHVLIPAGGWDIGPYKITFLLSAVLRMAIIPLLRHISEPQSEGAREVLGRVASSRPLGTLRHLRRMRGAAQPGQRAQSALALGRMKAKLAFEELVAALDDPVPSVRRQAALALGELGDSRAVEPLILALNTPDAGIRVQAAVSLGKLNDPRAAEAILRAMEAADGRDAAFTQAAAQALGRLRMPEAAEPLLEIAEEAENPARAAAIQSLGELGEESVAEPLTEMLRSDDALDAVEVSALSGALAKLDYDDAVPPLLERIVEADAPLLRRELANNAGAIIGRAGELYGWLAMDEYALDTAIAEMLNGHARDLRKEGRLSSARRTDAALEAWVDDQTGPMARHLRIAMRKASASRPSTAAACDALEWIAHRARTHGLTAEEALLALYAFDVIMKRKR